MAKEQPAAQKDSPEVAALRSKLEMLKDKAKRFGDSGDWPDGFDKQAALDRNAAQQKEVQTEINRLTK